MTRAATPTADARESWLARVRARPECAEPAWLLRLRREAAARLLWNPAQAYRKLTSRLWRIQAPTLVVWGADDRLVPLAYGEAWARSIPGARLVTLDRCGHLPPLEQPERFAEVALGFLDA